MSCLPWVAADRPVLPTGSATMSPGMRTADRYARYLYDCVKCWLNAPVLEIGCGFGTYTRLLLHHGQVICTDIDTTCLEHVQSRYTGRDILAAKVDLNSAEEVRALGRFGARSVFSTNVFEHVEKDEEAFRALRSAVTPDAKLCLVVPSHPRLYGYMDEKAGHFRRYTRCSVAQTLAAAGWRVRRTFYVNALGGLGWWFNHQFLRPKPIDSPSINNQLLIYDRLLVPLARMTDWMWRRVFGLSVVAIATNDSCHGNR
ncbi:MAG TPA: class I SAM-dependent methyltransferase [Gemmataceae bacterium]|nr:class I SAM-dependent methyltransferase [Gemmataceae bacterium]